MIEYLITYHMDKEIEGSESKLKNVCAVETICELLKF